MDQRLAAKDRTRNNHTIPAELVNAKELAACAELGNKYTVVIGLSQANGTAVL
jgi:hypothetical protein